MGHGGHVIGTAEVFSGAFDLDDGPCAQVRGTQAHHFAADVGECHAVELSGGDLIGVGFAGGPLFELNQAGLAEGFISQFRSGRPPTHHGGLGAGPRLPRDDFLLHDIPPAHDDFADLGNRRQAWLKLDDLLAQSERELRLAGDLMRPKVQNLLLHENFVTDTAGTILQKIQVRLVILQHVLLHDFTVRDRGPQARFTRNLARDRAVFHLTEGSRLASA